MQTAGLVCPNYVHVSRCVLDQLGVSVIALHPTEQTHRVRLFNMDIIIPSTHNFHFLFRLKDIWRAWYSGVHDPPQARRISPPTPGASQDEYWAYIDFQGGLYRLSWSGSTRCPSLANFPTGCDVEQVELSKDAAHVWKHSTLLGHGADSCIREDFNEFPVIKLAHPDPLARQRLRHEFEMLKSMTEHPSLPVPRFCSQPLIDSDGIYGYRMERLYQLDFDQLPQYHEAVKDALHQVHNAGFSVGDLHPGNAMLNEKDELIFIDLAHAGKVGETIPAYVPAESYQLPVFHAEPDTQRLAHFFSEAHSEHGSE